MLGSLRSFIGSKFERKSTGFSLSDPAAMSLFFGGGQTASGAEVSIESALRIPAVYACIKVISESISQLPLHLYRHLPDGGKEMAKEHTLFALLGSAPNPWTTSVEFRLAMQSALSAYGNAFAFISRNVDGSVSELIYLNPSQVAVEVDTASLEPFYRVTALDGSQNIYSRQQVFHLRNFGIGALSGYVGVSPISQCREAVGLAASMEEHAARLFGSGARPAGVFTFPGSLTQPVLDRLRASLAANNEGSRNSGKSAILEGGMKFEPLQFNSVDSQFLELRLFAIAEIARTFRIPLHLVGSLEKATFANIAEQSSEFVKFCLLPIVKNWESAISLSLLNAEERSQYFAEFDLDDLTRSDIEKRFASYAVGVVNGLLAPNECRAMENLPGYSGGEIYTRQLNTGEIAPAVPANTSEKAPWL